MTLRLREAYEPLRLLMQQCSLSESLVDVWRLSNEVEASNPDNLAEGGVAPWDLPLLAREVLLHGTLQGPLRLGAPGILPRVIGTIRDIENEASKLRLVGDDGSNSVVFDEMLRLTHRQFPWQQGHLATSLIRKLKTFGAPPVASMLVSETGLSIRQFFLLGFAVTGHLQTRFDVNSAQGYAEFGITPEQSKSFFERMSMRIMDIRRVLESHQDIGENWEYAWNGLEAVPLISLDGEHPNRLYCPVPQLLMRRFSGGLYYDLVESKGFGTAFGKAFEAYVGEVLHIAFPSPEFTVHAEQPYKIGKQRHDGPDWVVCGPKGNLFIECKAKRLTQVAKSADGSIGLREDLSTLAKAVVQHYKNVVKAVEGKSKWEPNGKPTWPVVLTFEDWYLLGPRLQGLLADAVQAELIEEGMDAQLMTEMPYSVMSCREFELCAGSIAHAGISPFFAGKMEGEKRQWLWPEYSAHAFPHAPRINFVHEFRADLDAVIPELNLPDDA